MCFGSYLKVLPFAAFQVILRKVGVLGPGASQHLGVVGKIQAKARRRCRDEGKKSLVEDLKRVTETCTQRGRPFNRKFTSKFLRCGECKNASREHDKIQMTVSDAD